MKLLLCVKCSDVFKLIPREIRSCECGEVRGRYIDDLRAEVNGGGFSLAMGNGSILRAISESHDPKVYHDKNIICWVRPHEGRDNLNTKINKDL